MGGPGRDNGGKKKEGSVWDKIADDSDDQRVPQTSKSNR